jgi:hypothetical protein
MRYTILIGIVVSVLGAPVMIRQLFIFILAGFLLFCGLGTIVLGLFATNQLTPPQTTLQMGAITVRAIPSCQLDRMISGPCFLADNAARWVIQLIIHNATGRSQQWSLYGGGHPPLFLGRR